MLRHPLDRVLSSYRWWQLMVEKMPASPAECRAYAAPPNATFSGAWLPGNVSLHACWSRHCAQLSFNFVLAGCGLAARRPRFWLGSSAN